MEKESTATYEKHCNADQDTGLTEIDGSFGEGGGQIIRNAVTLACILKKRLRVTNIRANRPNPGLASQHLQSILALLKISRSTSSSLAKGCTSFDLFPTGGHPPNYHRNVGEVLDETIDLITAGSITLCIQGILPYLITLSVPARLTIIGGTHVLKAPNTDYMHRVFLPSMRAIGYRFDLKQIRPGYFPRGGGSVIFSIHAENLGKFHHFDMNTRGKLLDRNAILNLTPPLFANNKEQLLDQMKSIDRNSIEVRKVNYASVEYFLKYENSSFGFYRLLEGRPPKPTAEEVAIAIREVESEVGTILSSQEAISVDSFMQDQLIIYMTLAKLQDLSQKSSFTTSAPLTDHTLSAIHVCQVLSGVKFLITEDKPTGSIQVTL